MKGNFPITGAFIDEITYDLASPNYSLKQWTKELDYMKKIGIDTLVFIRGGFENRTIFPTTCVNSISYVDLAGHILKEAAKRKMDVYFGLYLTDLTWQNGDAKTEIEVNKKFVAEAVERYGDYPSLKGWYIPHEVGNDILNIVDVFKGLSDICKSKTPDKPVLISPFPMSNPRLGDMFLTPEQHYEEWDKLFFKCGGCIDICAMQANANLKCNNEEYIKYSKMACDKHGVTYWTNVESFDFDCNGGFKPIPFEEFRHKIGWAQKYSEKLITFDFTHFLSPQSMFPTAKNLYNIYYNYYGKGKII